MKTAILNKGKEEKYFNQYPLVEEEDLFQHDQLEEGDVFHLLTSTNVYIATCYVGHQHKGLGWILTYQEDEVIDQAFLSNCSNKRSKSVSITIKLKAPMHFVYLMVKAMAWVVSRLTTMMATY